jgi:hypothetical protein
MASFKFTDLGISIPLGDEKLEIELEKEPEIQEKNWNIIYDCFGSGIPGCGVSLKGKPPPFDKQNELQNFLLNAIAADETPLTTRAQAEAIKGALIEIRGRVDKTINEVEAKIPDLPP